MGLVMRIVMTDILCPNTLRNVYVNGKAAGFSFDVRLGYYRGHYLSDIEELSISVDHRKIPEEDIVFQLNDKEFSPGELKYQISEFWNILAPATILVYQPGGLDPGDHEVALTLMLRSPYLPVPGSDRPHDYVPIDSSDMQTMALMGERSTADA